MSSKLDITFITNEEGEKLIDRFNKLIADTQYFDVLVGFFRTSGFHALWKALEKTEKIRILVGIGTDRPIIEAVKKAKPQEALPLSDLQIKHQFAESVEKEMAESEDAPEVEEGVLKFIEWLKSGKLEIRGYPTRDLHAKLYIMSFREEDRDKGRVITGSSNFTQAGLVDNLEFNVELKSPADYEFAKDRFNKLWEYAVDLSDKYIETINERTWLNPTITPYQLYLKFLYEHFKEDLARSDEVSYVYLPKGFKKLKYQEDAVLNAKRILEEYGGVFLADVVGLGKTYMAAMLANELEGKTLVLCPPVLLDPDNRNSWPRVLADFGVRGFECESIGKLDHVIRRGTERFANVIIDEAHRLRNEMTISYEKVAQICRGKRVILVSATPLNNRPSDILNQIKLFQSPRKSTIPNIPDLQGFFFNLESRLKGIDRLAQWDQYVSTVRENSKLIRENVLKHIMVRRTRSEIQKYYAEDLKKQGLKFPEVENPQPLYYELNEEEDKLFEETMRLVTQEFTYARYQPLLYYKEEKLDQLEEQAQKNMGAFMKVLLVKRLESSFFAFRQTINRFIRSYERFIEEFDRGRVFISKKYAEKIFDLLDNDDEEAIQKLIDEDKARMLPASGFKKEFREHLEKDLNILKEIRRLWLGMSRDPKLQKLQHVLEAIMTLTCTQGVKRDPSLLELQHELSTQPFRGKNKLIIFTESKETAEYLKENLGSPYSEETLVYTGSSPAAVRDAVIDNFDANSDNPKDDYRILISTDILSEGVNLHRSNIVVNYDIPWNPTRMMQRVGRINRVDTKFDRIYTFNFFPTKQSNERIKLKEAAQAKIHAFITMLGADAPLLTDGEPIESFELFNRLISKKTILGEDDAEESELKYLQIIRDIQLKNPDLFNTIKRLPKKARTAKKLSDGDDSERLLTYFRKGKLEKFYLCDKDKPQELDFISTAKLLEAEPHTPRQSLPKSYYELLEKNKQAFKEATTEEEEIGETNRPSGRDTASKLWRMLKGLKSQFSKQFTEDQEKYWDTVMESLWNGELPKKTCQKVFRELEQELKNNQNNPLKIISVLQKNIPEAFLKSHITDREGITSSPREVILSEILIG